MIVTDGAMAAITLLALVPREHRVEAIRATADVLATLLPWPSRRDRHQQAGSHEPRPMHEWQFARKLDWLGGPDRTFHIYIDSQPVSAG